MQKYQEKKTGFKSDPWVLYDHKDLYGKGDVGSLRIADYADLDHIKAFVLDQGANVVTLAGTFAAIKKFERTPPLSEFNECSGCQTWVYNPML